MAATAVGWALVGKGEICESSSVPAVVLNSKPETRVAEKIDGVKEMVRRGIDSYGHRLQAGGIGADGR